jgi:hypothetical protein
VAMGGVTWGTDEVSSLLSTCSWPCNMLISLPVLLTAIRNGSFFWKWDGRLCLS